MGFSDDDRFFIVCARKSILIANSYFVPDEQLNDENNVCVYDRDFATQWERIFTDDLAACRRVTLDEWRGREVVTKLREMIASLLRVQV